MAQSTILAVGVAAATSSEFALAAGDAVTVGIFSSEEASLPEGVTFKIMQKTPGASNYVDRLNEGNRNVVISGPGTFLVTRPAYTGTAFGVFTET